MGIENEILSDLIVGGDKRITENTMLMDDHTNLKNSREKNIVFTNHVNIPDKKCLQECRLYIV